MKYTRLLSILLVFMLVFSAASLVLADNVQNDVVAGGNDTFTAGGSTVVNYRITANSGDGEAGCNATVASPATVAITVPAGVTASPSSLTFTSCGTNQSVTFSSNTPGNYVTSVSVSDSGVGTYNLNPAVFTLHVLPAPPPSDTTAPVITLSVSGTLGNNGWYVSDVTVSWTVVDNESAVTSTTGCGPTVINSDTTGQTLTCSATSAGGTSSQSVTIKRDATAPTITGTRSPAANGSGWNNTDVVVSFTCGDATSGVFSCGPNQTVSGEGANQSVTGTAMDNAGNTATATVSDINIDKTAPTATATASPAANSNGWNNTDVTVSFSGTDALSGIATCDSDVTLTGEGAGQLASGVCTDKAGNVSAPATATVNIDKTAPTASASASPAPNANGWNNTDVTVSFSGADALSGLDECTAPVVVSDETAAQTVSGACSDLAGNTSDPVSLTVKLDKTAPVVALVGGPVDGATYYFGFVPAAPTCSASDALSGLDGSCAVAGYSAAVGSHTVTASASDLAGNSASDSVSYTVSAWTLKGFYQPVDMGGVFNAVKGGSTVPLKFEIFAGPTELTDTAYVSSLSTKTVTCGTAAVIDDIETTSTGGTSLRYDATGGQFIYNWQTPKKPGTCYQVTMTTDDGSSLVAFFKLK